MSLGPETAQRSDAHVYFEQLLNMDFLRQIVKEGEQMQCCADDLLKAPL
jgi:hypothetical protein